MALLGSRRHAPSSGLRSNNNNSNQQQQQQQESNNNNNNKSLASTQQKYLTNCKSLYSCIYCRTHLANHDELISRSFQGNRSRAYLFNSLINITTGPSVQRELNTGAHAVADVFCSNCSTTIGWKYEKAYVESQKYKEGKYIIELAHVVRENRHLELDKRDKLVGLLIQQQQHEQQQQFHDNLIMDHSGSGSLSPPAAPSSISRDRSSIASSPPLNYDHHHHHLYACLDDFERLDDSAGMHESVTGSDEEEEEVLMFPFHDDLYGERASYSNLSHTRLSSYKRRAAAAAAAAAANRRSLHLDFDWRLGGNSFASTTSSGAKSRNLSPMSSPGDNEDQEESQNCRKSLSPKLSTTMFNLEASSSSTTSSGSTSSSDNNNYQQQQPKPSTSKDIKHFINTNNQQQQQECDQDKSTTTTTSSGDKQQTANSLAPNDDEETFYDCCTDHNISSSSSSTSATNK